MEGILTWQEIYKKYKDTELMKEFDVYLDEQMEIPQEVLDMCCGAEKMNIKDIWGYLICFAEDYLFYIDYDGEFNLFDASIIDKESNTVIDSDTGNKSQEECMLWCADKFFEISTN